MICVQDRALLLLPRNVLPFFFSTVQKTTAGKPAGQLHELDLPLHLYVQVEVDKAKRDFPERGQICYKYRTSVLNCSQDN